MSHRDDDPTIPTLTQRAPARHDVPVLTEMAGDEPPWDTPHRVRAAPHVRAITPTPRTAFHASERTPVRPTDFSAPGAAQAPDTHTTPSDAHAWAHQDRADRETPGDAVLRAALQADIEDAVQDAMDEALHMVRARLEARLPQIVADAIRRTRLG